MRVCLFDVLHMKGGKTTNLSPSRAIDAESAIAAKILAKVDHVAVGRGGRGAARHLDREDLCSAIAWVGDKLVVCGVDGARGLAEAELLDHRHAVGRIARPRSVAATRARGSAEAGKVNV